MKTNTKILLIELKLGDETVASVRSDLVRGEITVGRAADNLWRAPEGDRTMADHHAVISLCAEGVKLVATKGEYVRYRSEKIPSRTLKIGDRAVIGDCELFVTQAKITKYYAPFHRLEPLDDEFGSGTVDISSDRFVIGAAETAALRLPDDVASREHAVIRLSGDGAWIADAGSRNGTFVNGDRLGGKERLLKDTDVVAVGSWKFRFLDRAVPHVRARAGRNVLVALVTAMVAGGAWLAWYYRQPAAIDLLRQAMVVAESADFDTAEACIDEASKARGYENCRRLCEEFSERVQTWRTSYSVWCNFREHLEKGEWRDAVDDTGRLNTDVRFAWDWNSADIDERIADIDFGRDLVNAIFVLRRELDYPDWSDDDEAQAMELRKTVKSDAPDFLSGEKREWTLPAKKYVRRLVRAVRENAATYVTMTNLVANLDYKGGNLDETERRIEELSRKSRGYVRVFAQRLRTPFGMMKKDILALARDREVIASLDFTEWKGAELISNPDDYSLTPNLLRLYRRIVEERGRLNRFAAEILAMQARLAGDFRIDFKGVPDALLDFEDRKKVENALNCCVFKLKRPPHHGRTEPADDYDRLFGFEFLRNYMIQGAYIYPEIVVPDELSSARFKCSLYQLHEFWKEMDSDRKLLADEKYRDLVTGNLAKLDGHFAELSKRYEVVRAYFAKVSADPSETPRRALIAQAAELYLTPHAQITKKMWESFTKRRTKIGSDMRALAEELDPVRAEQAKAAAKKIIELGIPGSPATGKVWNYK